MAHVVTSIIEGVFPITDAYGFEVDDTPVFLGTLGVTTWYRIALANSGAAGTETDPSSFASALDAVLGADYSVPPPTSTGCFAIKRRAGAGAGSIDFSTTSEGEILAALLGYASTVLSFADGETIPGDYPPAYRLCLIGAGHDTDWQAEGVGAAYSETDGGTVYGLAGTRVMQRRQFTLEHHVRDAGLWAAAPFAGEFPNTPVLPDPGGAYVGKMVDQSEDMPLAKPPLPFTVLDFWATCRARPLALLLFRFQQVIVGAADPLWDEAYLDKKTCEQGPGIKLRDARWNSVMSPGPWGFVLYAAGVTF